MLPGIFEESDRLSEPRTADMPAIFALLDRCWEMEASLQTFYHDIEEAVEGPLYWSKLATLTLPPDEVDGKKLFPVAFYFDGLPTAFTTMMYWLNQLLLWRTIMEIYGRVLKCGHAPTQLEDPTDRQLPYVARLRPLEHRKDLVSLAKNICQTVEFCLQEDKRSQGPGALMVPLLSATITFKYSPGCGRELEWARAAMTEVSERGWRITTFLEPGPR